MAVVLAAVAALVCPGGTGGLAAAAVARRGLPQQWAESAATAADRQFDPQARQAAAGWAQAAQCLSMVERSSPSSMPR